MTHSITLEITSRKAPPIPTTATLTRLLCLVSYFVQWNMVKPWWMFSHKPYKVAKTSNCPDASQGVLSAAPGESGRESHVGTDRHLSERRLEETWVRLLKALRLFDVLPFSKALKDINVLLTGLLKVILKENERLKEITVLPFSNHQRLAQHLSWHHR